MRRSASITIVVMAAILGLVVTTSAQAKGGPRSTTTTTEPHLWTCAERVENGATWVLGTWNGSSYVVDGLPACIDLRPEHAVAMQWSVTWSGDVVRPPVKGLQFVFETGVHGWDADYPSTVVYSESGTWTTEAFAPYQADAFVFAAMPSHRDTWNHITITVTPTGS